MNVLLETENYLKVYPKKTPFITESLLHTFIKAIATTIIMQVLGVLTTKLPITKRESE